MTDGNIHENNRRLDDREDFDALQEVTAELDRAEARIEQLEAELSEQVGWVRHMAEDLIAAEAKLAKEAAVEAIVVDDTCMRSRTTLAEIKGETEMTKQQELDDLKDAVASWRKQRDALAAKYQGVRPSYVSTDLAILEERIQRYVAQIKEME